MRRVVIGVVSALVWAVLALPPAVAQGGQAAVATPADTLAVIPPNQSRSAVEIALEISRGTPRPLPVARVLVARDDAFADALTSGVLQGAAPLLLVPRRGPVPADVLAEIARLQAAEAVLLGGEAALAPAVADELAAAGLAVRRLAGASREETAVRIAEEAGSPDGTYLLARAFGTAGAAASQGFADALGAGGLSAERGWPVLLTATDALTPATREHLVEAGARRVLVVGGTAAISDAVEQELRDLGLAVERVAGDDRFETAVEVAKEGGVESAADVDRVTLVEGTGDDAWAGGFAAAGHAAVLDAPIALAASDQVPAATASFLAQGIGVVDEGDAVVITCVIGFTTCEEARRLSGLPASPLFTFSPVPGAPVAAGQQIVVSVDPIDLAAGQSLFFDGPCFGQQEVVELDDAGIATLLVPPDLGAGCDVIVSTTLANGQFGGVFAFWPAGDGTVADPDVVELSYWIFSEGGALQAPLALDVDTSCGDDPTVATGRVHHAQFAGDDGGGVSTEHLAPRAVCRVQAHLPPETIAASWTVTSRFSGGAVYAAGTGSTATLDLGAIPSELPEVLLAWEVELSNPSPTAARPLPAAATVRVRGLREGVALSCDDGTTAGGDGALFVATVTAGAGCTASTATGTVVLSQVGTPFAFEPSVTFTADPTRGDVLLFRI